MFHHQAQRFGESEDCVGWFATGIREILDRKKGAIHVIMPVDQKQLHAKTVAESGMVAQPSRLRLFVFASGTLALL